VVGQDKVEGAQMFEELLMQGERVISVVSNIPRQFLGTGYYYYSMVVTNKRVLWVRPYSEVTYYRVTPPPLLHFIELDDIDSVAVAYDSFVKYELKNGGCNFIFVAEPPMFSFERRWDNLKKKDRELAHEISRILSEAKKNASLVIDEILDVDEVVRYKCEQSLSVVIPSQLQVFIPKSFYESLLRPVRLCITDRYALLYELSQELKRVKKPMLSFLSAEGTYIILKPQLNYAKIPLKDAEIRLVKRRLAYSYLELATSGSALKLDFGDLGSKHIAEIFDKIRTAVGPPLNSIHLQGV
jgi:hypothetical protein